MALHLVRRRVNHDSIVSQIAGPNVIDFRNGKSKFEEVGMNPCSKLSIKVNSNSQSIMCSPRGPLCSNVCTLVSVRGSPKLVVLLEVLNVNTLVDACIRRKPLAANPMDDNLTGNE